MLDQDDMTSLVSAEYLEDYLDGVENLPEDIQRSLSRMRALDIAYSNYMREVEAAMDEFLEAVKQDVPSPVREFVKDNLQRAQEVKDEQMSIVENVKADVDNKTKQLEVDMKNLTTKCEDGEVQKEGNVELGAKTGTTEASGSSFRRTRNSIWKRPSSATSSVGSKGKAQDKDTTAKEAVKKVSTGQKRGRKKKTTNSDDSDDDEVMYCICEKGSHGKMIQCDNDLCPIEWFHFSCVKLRRGPQGNWYCPKCRGESAEAMKPRAFLLKELEEYNRQQEMKV